MREAGDRTGRIKQATSMPNCDSLKLNISSKIILLNNMCKFHLCLMQNLFSELVLKRLKTFRGLFVEVTRAMLTSRLANKNTSLLYHCICWLSFSSMPVAGVLLPFLVHQHPLLYSMQPLASSSSCTQPKWYFC